MLAETSYGKGVAGATLYAFTADEIMELRRLLLPNRMRHHDTPAEKRLRLHVASIQGKPSHD